jgi:hypothetical protein
MDSITDILRLVVLIPQSGTAPLRSELRKDPDQKHIGVTMKPSDPDQKPIRMTGRI